MMKNIMGVVFMSIVAINISGMDAKHTGSNRIQVTGVIPHQIPTLSSVEYEKKSMDFCSFVQDNLIKIIAKQRELSNATSPEAHLLAQRCERMANFLAEITFASRLTGQGEELLRNTKKLEIIKAECKEILSGV